MNKKLTTYALFATFVLQILTIISGFVIPKIILSNFGSDTNGMVSSVTQFLNYIQLLEGGVSSVAMSALYKSLANNDEKKISGIIKAVDDFFKKIGLIYVIYAILVAFIYPIIVDTPLNYVQSVFLIVIIASSIFVQYFFSLTYRVLINADRRGYIVSIAQSILIIINILFTIIVVKVYPSIHLLKLGTVISYITQPIIFSCYVKKHYKIDKKVQSDNESLSQKWNGFGHNLAYFIHTNTDIVVLTIFTNLKIVSVYAVYASIATALKTLIISISAAIKPSFANVLVLSDLKKTNRIFDYYEMGINFISSILFSCCIVLIVPFVKIYTVGVVDVNYYKPVFAVILCVGELIYCIRDPFVSSAYLANHFKQTAKYAYIEAISNIIISILLVYQYGLIGVAIGTLISMLYRMIVQVIYLRNNILNRPLKKWIKGFISVVISIVISLIIIQLVLNFEVYNYLTWFIMACITLLISSCVTILVFLFLNTRTCFEFLKTYFLK